MSANRDAWIEIVILAVVFVVILIARRQNRGHR